MFDEFIRLSSGEGEEATPGSGLGLAISRRLARAMGGDLVAEDGNGAGATFTFLLPAAPSQTSAEASA